MGLWGGEEPQIGWALQGSEGRGVKGAWEVEAPRL